MNFNANAWFGVAVVSLAVAMGCLLPWVSEDGRNVGATVLVVVLIICAHRVFGSSLLSPVQIVTGGLFALALSGRWLYDSVASAQGGASVVLQISPADAARTQFLILSATALILTGALLAVGVSGQMKRIVPPTLHGSLLRERTLRLMAAGAVLPLLMLVSDYHPAALLRRSLYIENGHVGPTSVLSAAGSTLSIAAMAVLGYVWATGRFRAWVAFALLLYIFTFFGLGSRQLALIPVLFSVGMFAAKPSRSSRLAILLSCILAFYLIGLPLEFRELSSHGILPYAAALPDIVKGEHPWAATSQNILISFPLIGFTAFRMTFPLRDLFVSVSPLPGGRAGWYDIASFHRLNAYTPAAGLGELANAGWVATVIVCLLIGATLAWLDVRSKLHTAKGRQMLGLAIVMVSSLFLLFFVQYNLRSAIRLLYYALALDLVAFAALTFRGVLASRSRRTPEADPWLESGDGNHPRHSA